MITHNIIGFQQSATSGKYIYATDPAMLATLPEAFATATAEETDRAVSKAHQAFNIYKKKQAIAPRQEIQVGESRTYFSKLGKEKSFSRRGHS